MLGKWLAEQILAEDNGIDRVIAIYPGRFQPMGKHHVKTFNQLAKQFGTENTFIATSDKTDNKESPLNFKEKRAVAVKHGIPEDKIVQVRNPYQSLEVLQKFPKETTAVVFMYGVKDAGRLSYTKKDGSPGYFQKYEEGMPLEPYTDRGYVLIAPHVKFNVPGFGEMSGTTIRQAMAIADEKTFKNVMGFYDPKIHNMFRDKFSQLVNESIERFLVEITSTAGSAIGLVDDGPRYYYGNQATYRARNNAMAERLGFSILNYIVKDDPIEIHNTEFPDGPPLSVSYFPVGIEGARNYGTNYSKELKGLPAYREWSKYIRKVAERVGYKFINFLDAEEAIADTVNAPTKPGKLTESRLLTEGGASGHMNHPFDDRDLTFAEMKQIVRLALQGQLDIEEAVTEKTDGQNLNVTFKNGKVGAARNKATIKDPMTVDQVKAQFEGRGDIADAFGFAMEDLEKAILALPEAKREEIFQNGTRFVNLEIIYPATKNVINYGSDAYLQFHGLNEFDLETGNKTGEYPEYGDMLQKMIADVNADTQEHFKIIPPNIIKMQKSRDFDAREKYFIDAISKLQREFGLTDDDEVIMYHQRWWERFIDREFPGIDLTVREGLIRRWAYDDKSYRLNAKNISDANALQKATEFDKKNFAVQNKKNVFAFEKIFLELGAEVLKNVTNYLAANPDTSVKELRKDIAATIKQLKASNDIQALQKLQHELKRVQSMGGFEKLVPSEGIVFVYKGKTYKLTGLFAPINQLLGIARYAR